MRLVAKNGPLAGTALTLADGVIVAGPNAGGAGQHRWLRVRINGHGAFVLQALDRRAPVFVNGLPLTTRPLEPRDELRVGDSLFIVQADDPAPASAIASCPVRRESLRAAHARFQVGFDELLLDAGGDRETREGRDLLSLIRLGAALSSIRDLAGIDAALAGFVLDIVPADRVVLAGGDAGPADVRSAWCSGGPPADAIAIDTDLLEGTVQERAALVFKLGERDIVVAPMMAFGRPTGCIWAEMRGGETIDVGHVRLLLVVGALVAVARERVLEAARLQEDNELLQAEINLEHNMVGRSRPMRALFDRIARVARTDSTLLLRGESGTGKELVARAAHRNSARADRAFIAINCAAITESLLESELFGHEKGAFTGAVGLKKGKLELADRGSLFLDEIGELPLLLQAKLLRALQEREFERVGGTRPVRVDFRLIAATNRDLEAAVRAGTFRQDLFYRLNVVTLSLPPLRERKDDLALLAEYFVRKHAPRCGRRVRGIAPAALARLEKHHWPGNVRELENVVEQALALGAGEDILADDLPAGLGDALASPCSSLDYHATVEETKRELIVRAFERAGQSHAGAARLLGVHPNYLHRLMRNFNLRSAVGGRQGQ
jgi:two-component system, NtrC family, response regulator HydG